MADTPSDKRQANEKLPKKGGKLEKYKWWIVGGLAVIAALVYFFVSRSNANAANAQNATNAQNAQSGIDPTTGLPYALEYGDYGSGAYGMGGGYGGGGGYGLRGPRGLTGARGPRGHTGKTGASGGGGSGSERQWLIKQTGSQHPWTWLKQHGEWARRSGSGYQIYKTKR